MKTLRLLALLAAVPFSSVLTGCGGTDAAPVTAPDDAAEDLTKAGPLSKDLVCAAVAAANDNSQGDGLVVLAEKDLKGDALSDFKAFQKGMAGDYPSIAYDLPVKLGKKTYTFIMVVEMNDGGGSVGIYRTDGRNVTTESGGESDDIVWSAPGDKCDS